MVSFKDNQPAKIDAIAAVNEAERIIQSSNSLPSEERENATNSLSSWGELINKTSSFAVGAFKFMVWDRIKAVVESAIEEAYKTTLIGLLITLGTIIVNLL